MRFVEFYSEKFKKETAKAENHFNRSLSRELHVLFVEKPKNAAADNWKLYLRLLFLRVGGGMTRVVINDRVIWRVVAYAERYCDLRDRMIVRLLLTRGLRTGEVCTALAEKINWDAGAIAVFDSKKKVWIDVPLDLETLVMLEALLKGRRRGYVFQRKRKQHAYADKPLRVQAVWALIRRMAERAGVKDFNPRMFRRHLAAFWLQKAKGGLAELQVLMRHKNPQVTWDYANQFVFDDQVRREADRVINEMMKRGAAVTKEIETV